MLTAITHVVTNSTPTKIVDGADLGEFEVLIQVQFSALIGASNVTLTSNAFQIDPIENGIGDPRGYVKLRLQSEDLYALSRIASEQVINVLIYSV